MSPTTAAPVVLDWRLLRATPTVHTCDCEHCDYNGEVENNGWRDLVPAILGDVEYLTDRFIAIRRDRAPVPDNYEGLVLGGAQLLVLDGKPSFSGPVTDTPPADDVTFGPSTKKMLAATGWTLRALAHPDNATRLARNVHGVVDEHGEHIGWAIAQRKIE